MRSRRVMRTKMRKKKPRIEDAGLLYLGWESNPHATRTHDFESCASTNSATKAWSFFQTGCEYTTDFYFRKKSLLDNTSSIVSIACKA